MTDDHNNMQENDETFADDKLTDEEYIRKQFADLPCPPLPESLRAENIWKKICAEEGDGIVTVPPQAMSEEPMQQETPEAEAAQNVVNVDFEANQKNTKSSKKGKVLSLSRRRNTIAVACSLVLVVGLSAIFWKLNPSMEKTNMMLDNQAPQVRESAAADVEEAVEEAVEETIDEAIPEEVIVEERTLETQDEAAEMPETASAPQPVKEQTPPLNEQAAEQDEGEKLRQRMLDSLEAAKAENQQLVKSSGNPVTAEEAPSGYALPNGGEMVDTGAQQEEAVEESIDEEAETAPSEENVPQVASEMGNEEGNPSSEGKNLQEVPEEKAPNTETSENASGENKPTLIQTLKNQQQQLPKTYPLKNGSLTHDPAANQIILKDQNGAEQHRMSIAPQTKVLTGDNTFCTVNENTEGKTVTMVLYLADDLSQPKEVNRVVHQGVLFDSYQYAQNSYALVTSVWFTREQIEAGDYLPKVNDQTISTDKVNIIEGYGEADRVHFLLTTILKNNSAKTRADLHLK